jgi:hypothetical protein
VNVLVVLVGAHQQRIAAEVRQQAQLDLRVIGGEQLRAGRGDEGGANLAAQLGADGNVLQIRIDGREPAGGRGRRLKVVCTRDFGIGQQRQRVDVVRFELGEMPVFEHQARNFVLLGKLLQHVLRGGDHLALAAAGGRGQPRSVKSTSPSCLGELMLKRRPASSKMRSPTRSTRRRSAWKARPARQIDAHAGLLHAERDRRQRQDRSR